MLAIPSARTILADRCGPDAARDSTGVMIGFVRSATDGMGRAGATLKVSWSELVIAADGMRRSVPSVSGETSAAGGVALCGLPVGGQVMVRAWSGSDSSGFAELVVPRDGVLRRDLYVGAARTVTVRDSTDSRRGRNCRPARGGGAAWRGAGLRRTPRAGRSPGVLGNGDRGDQLGQRRVPDARPPGRDVHARGTRVRLSPATTRRSTSWRTARRWPISRSTPSLPISIR